MSGLAVLVVGCGAMGQRHGATIAADPDVSWLGAMDPHPERALALAHAHGAHPVPMGTGPDTLEVDLVVVSAATDAHVEAALPWLEAGKAVLVEKPLARSVEAAQRLAWPRCRVGMSERFNPAVRRAAIEGLTTLHAVRCVPRARPDGVVTDLMIHDIDLLLSLTGPGVECTEAEALGPPDAPHTVRARWVGPGVDATLVATREGPPERRWTGRDAQGAFHIDLLERRVERGGQVEPVDGDALRGQWAAFRRDAPGLADAHDAIHGLRLAEQVLHRLRTAP